MLRFGKIKVAKEEHYGEKKKKKNFEMLMLKV